MSPLDIAQVRKEFPILERTVHGKPLVYLDNAATTQKPRAVIDSLERFYLNHNANIHRGVHRLSQEATEYYEAARGKLQTLIGAESSDEIVFVRGATEAINLVASSFVAPRLHEGDEILITHMEHHSNIVPWQLVCGNTGAELRVAPIDEEGALDLEAFARRITSRTRFVSVAHVSNSLGSVNPVAEIVRLSHDHGIPVLVDGAQAVAHMEVDVQQLGCDFYAFSGHKMYGPTGIGALYGQAEQLEATSPYQGGGEMILSVSFERTTFNRVPHRFEAGTPNIAGAIALGAAADYLGELGLASIREREEQLLTYATREISKVPRLRIIGSAPEKSGVVSFVLEGIHPHDVGTILDREGIAVRTGHHCAQPVMDRYGLTATTRASFAIYNTEEEVDRLVAGLAEVLEIFA